MRCKKIIAMVLCAVMLVGVCAGCGTESLADVVALYNNTSDSPYDYDSALKEYEPDELMATVNGLEITWEEMFYWVRYYMEDLSKKGPAGEDNAQPADEEDSGYELIDWEAELSNGVNYEDGILTMALKKCIYTKVVESMAAEFGAQLTEGDLMQLDMLWNQTVSTYGSEEAALAALKNNALTYDLYMYQFSIDYLYKQCYIAMFGEDGSALTDQEVMDHVADKGYMMIRHIYVRNTDEQNVKLEQSEQDALYATMEAALAELDAYTGDDIEGFFNEMMDKYSEDENREGYSFQADFMLEEVAETAAQLEEYEYSDIIESTTGYHIVLRVPVDPDLEPNIYFNPVGEGYTLRRTVADEMFEEQFQEWMENADVVPSDLFKAIQMDELFPVK